MKTKGLFYVIMAFAVALFMQSCSKDDGGGTTVVNPPGTIDTTKNDTLKKPMPTISWKTTAGFKSQDGTEPAGNAISFGITAKSSTGLKITKIVLNFFINGGNNVVILDSAVNDSILDKDWINITLGNLTKSKNKYTAVVTQSNGQSAAVSFTITATSGVRGVAHSAGIQLGAQGNTTFGTFFNPSQASTGVMFQAQANSNQANVHVIYYSGTTNKETFSAPNDAQITQVFANISNWTVKNATTFKKTTMTATDFDNIPAGDATIIDNQCTNGVFVTKITKLAVGDVIAYRTQDGNHYALFKITSISAGSNGSITFDMKNPLF